MQSGSQISSFDDAKKLIKQRVLAMFDLTDCKRHNIEDEEQLCLEWIKNLRWRTIIRPSKNEKLRIFKCNHEFRDRTRCTETKHVELSNGLLLCRNTKCHHIQSPLAGTAFHQSHLPISKWLELLWDKAVSIRNGTKMKSIRDLQNLLNIGSNRTVLKCLQIINSLPRLNNKIRRHYFKGEISILKVRARQFIPALTPEFDEVNIAIAIENSTCDFAAIIYKFDKPNDLQNIFKFVSSRKPDSTFATLDLNNPLRNSRIENRIRRIINELSQLEPTCPNDIQGYLNALSFISSARKKPTWTIFSMLVQEALRQPADE